MGEYGMSPVYFAHALTFPEAAAFLRGAARRQQVLWETARFTAYNATAPLSKSFDESKVPVFPWEAPAEAAKSEEEELAEIEALRARARARDEEYLKKKNNGNG